MCGLTPQNGQSNCRYEFLQARLQRITLTCGRGDAFRQKKAWSRERVPVTTLSKLL